MKLISDADYAQAWSRVRATMISKGRRMIMLCIRNNFPLTTIFLITAQVLLMFESSISYAVADVKTDVISPRIIASGSGNIAGTGSTNISESTRTFYELSYSINNEVCRQFLLMLNIDLSKSPYVSYTNPEHFVPWEVLLEPINAPVSYKMWQMKYQPPLAKAIVDMDNDGKVEFLYLITYRVPVTKQWLVLLKSAPHATLKLTNDPMEQFTAFSAFVNAEKKVGNLFGDVQFFQPIALSEMLGHSISSQEYFDAETASLFIYKHGNERFLAAENIEYPAKSSIRNTKNSWYLLFSISKNAQPKTTCILKRLN